MDGRKDNWLHLQCGHRLLHGSNDGCRLPSQLLAAVSFTIQYRQEGRVGAVAVNRQASLRHEYSVPDRQNDLARCLLIIK